MKTFMANSKKLLLIFFTALFLTATDVTAQETASFGRFQNCPVLKNDRTRVVLCPELGGRVLEYSLDGKNSLFVSRADYNDGSDSSTHDRWQHDPSAGRFDIGPEQVVPSRKELFLGRWKSQSASALAIELISEPCVAAGVRLTRSFELSPVSSRLVCTQTIHNISDHEVRYCHWSRTLANGSGIVVIPLDDRVRFPKRYVRFDKGTVIQKPEDPEVRIRGKFLEILGPTQSPKLGMDSFVGWLAHQQKSGLLFIKQFPTFPDRMYGDAMAMTIATWAPEGGETVELEPIGPLESIAVGKSSSFTEIWTLLDRRFPDADMPLDLEAIERDVATLPATPWSVSQP